MILLRISKTNSPNYTDFVRLKLQKPVNKQNDGHKVPLNHCLKLCVELTINISS